MKQEEKGNERTYGEAGKKLQKETDDLFQRGIHHQHDESYLGLVRGCPHG
jgi:hypothetical protein